ncbi:Mesaconyl-C(4)-CoA hydratase [Grifola frondosa]|uniref:Mesaconyl-C(4)-CoA hydratase n=1 Tax=Grifola frondosa TaxID=5627 RepID=A0A1C7MGL0_GRIFR|nr:Mesaconyl-C(4)-CoA hydratase [Grifola frondosa]
MLLLLRRRSLRLSPSTGPSRRHLSSLPDLNIAALDRWVASQSQKQLSMATTISADHLRDLYSTLPTRDGSTRPFEQPKEGSSIAYGHHLAFFHPRNPERLLRADGTDADFCPSEPWTRRMAVAVAQIASVEKKGFGGGSPMVFVKQKIDYAREGSSEVCIAEERSHVYLAHLASRRAVKEVDVPKADFEFEYVPSPTTLFRFSALTFNGHYIHLDKDYAKSEGYLERLVHAPLTALMMLETAMFHIPEAAPKAFEYRAMNPIVVNSLIRLCGAREGQSSVRVWAEDENKVVGMTDLPANLSASSISCRFVCHT